MAASESIAKATETSDKAQSFLSEHSIPPTPKYYAVAYNYITGEIPKLNQAIEQVLSNKGAIDAVAFDSLHSEYISQSDQFNKSVVTPFELTIKGTLKKLDSHVEHENETLINFDKIDGALSQISATGPLNKFVNYIINSISNSQEKRKSLSEELNKASKEVAELKKQLEASKKEAHYDALTGLLNRRGCDEKLKELDIQKAHSAFVVDIDHFKNINDSFGHLTGDRVIQHIAKIIKSSIDVDDLAVRFGGEEFLVVVVNKTASQSRLIAEEIRKKVINLKLIQRQSNLQLPRLTVSVGIAETYEDANWISLFNKADNALYEAKNTGRNKSVIATSTVVQMAAM